jgi:hypothetical protein
MTARRCPRRGATLVVPEARGQRGSPILWHKGARDSPHEVSSGCGFGDSRDGGAGAL